MAKIKLMNGDCLVRMPEIADGSIDLILCDLPYGTTSCAWDSVIPYDKLWAEYLRVLTPGGTIVLTAAQPFTSMLVASNPKMFRYAWVWVKNAVAGFAQAKNKPMTKHEDILVFSNAKTGHVMQCKNRMNYNPQGLRPHGKTVVNSKTHRETAFGGRRARADSYVQEFTGYPDSVLHFDCQRDGIHPTQKPVALMEYLIKTYTSEGQTVMDNTMGSGTTGIAAVNTKRSFIGIERDPKYFRLSTSRIKAASKSKEKKVLKWQK